MGAQERFRFPRDLETVRPHIVEVRLRLAKLILTDPLEETLNADLEQVEELHDYRFGAGQWSVEQIQELWFGGMRERATHWRAVGKLLDPEGVGGHSADTARRGAELTAAAVPKLDGVASGLRLGVRVLQKIARLQIELGEVPYDYHAPDPQAAFTAVDLHCLEALLRGPVFPIPYPHPWVSRSTDDVAFCLGFYHTVPALSGVFPHLVEAAHGLCYLLLHAPERLQRCPSPLKPAQYHDYRLERAEEDSPRCRRFFIKWDERQDTCPRRRCKDALSNARSLYIREWHRGKWERRDRRKARRRART
jgi:hypothetical protein